MKNKFLKFTVIILVLAFVPVFPALAIESEGFFQIESDHSTLISCDAINDDNGDVITQINYFGPHSAQITQELSGDKITLVGFVVCDVKFTSFGYGYVSDGGTAVMNSEKLGDEDGYLNSTFGFVVGETGEASRFSIDVPVYDGDNEFYALIELEDGSIYEILHVLYKGTNGKKPEYPKEQDVAVTVTVDGTDIKNKPYTVSAYINYDYFFIDMEDVTEEIDTKFGAEYAVREILINGTEVDFGDQYDNMPRGDLLIFDGYEDGDEISVTYEKVASATIDPNYEGGKKIKIRAVHGAPVSFDEVYARKDMIIVDYNTKPDGSGESCIVDGYVVFPSDLGIDLNGLTLYAIWKELGIPGDVNGDGRLNNKDVVTLFRYVSNSNTACDEFAADVNNDGRLNNKDVVNLFRYISGGDVKAYYYGYKLNQSVAGFKFEVPKGFVEAGADDESLVLIAEVSVWPSYMTLSQVSDAQFRQILESNANVKVDSITRTTINKAYAVRVKYTMKEGNTAPCEAVFIVKDTSLLTLTYIDASGLYTSDLEKTVLSVKW